MVRAQLSPTMRIARSRPLIPAVEANEQVDVDPGSFLPSGRVTAVNCTADGATGLPVIVSEPSGAGSRHGPGLADLRQIPEPDVGVVPCRGQLPPVGRERRSFCYSLTHHINKIHEFSKDL